MRNLIKICTKCHSERNHAVAKSKNLGRSAIASLVRGAAISGLLFLAACGDDSSDKTAGGTEEDAGIIAIENKTVSGVSQKGPFVNGSGVTVQELDGETLTQTGLGFEGKIKSDLGEFSVGVKRLASQYVLLRANGFYRNEVTGEKSNSQVTLYALSDLSNRDEVNVNLLTHLAYERSLYLATGKEAVSVAGAKKQAEGEVFGSFAIEGKFDAAEDLNIFGESDQSAALLAISIMMQGDLKEADFSERLDNYARDIEADGTWDDVATATQIADWASTASLDGRLGTIRAHVESWGQLFGVPPFEKYVDNFWWQKYGLGVCDTKREGEVLQASNALSVNNGVHFICNGGVWRKATTLEFDTYKQACDEDGKIVKGNVTGAPYDCDVKTWRAATDVEGVLGGCIEKRFGEVSAALNTHYICEKRNWRKATDIEKDTYMWADPAKKSGDKDGDVKYGDVVKTNCYVYEDDVWRSGNSNDCSLGLHGCTALRQDTVGKGSDKVWHICDSKAWRNATTYEKDTFGWKDSTDGAIKKGNVTDSIYVFDKTAWRTASAVEGKLGGCVAAIADSVGKVGSTYYICKSNKWMEASAIEYDTYRWATGKDGDIKSGSVNTNNCYVYENSVWRGGNASDCSLGLRGCTKLRQDTVGLGSDNTWYKCVSQKWRTATNIEKDTATWGVGEFDGEVRAGQVNKSIYYIFETGKAAWSNATTLEKDTYDYANNKDWPAGTDGEIKKGAVTDTVYVFDATAWRVADNIEKVLGGCVTAIADSVGKVGTTYYICSPRKWETATALQYDTYKRDCSEDGKMFNGSVNTATKYVCDNGAFRAATTVEVNADSACTSYNRDVFHILPKVGGVNNYSYYKCTEEGWTFTTEKLNQGTMTDERDGHVYKTIGIKTQMWMAENLNFRYTEIPYKVVDSYTSDSYTSDSTSWCYNNSLDSCAKYGRLYTWAAAIDSVYWAKQGKTCGHEEDPCGLPDKVQGICPEGWHVPTYAEFDALFTAVGGISTAGTMLKSTNGWNRGGNGTDAYGFSALPAGGRDGGGSFLGQGQNVRFWSSTDYSSLSAYYMYLSRLGDGAALSYSSKIQAHPVRCVKDEE